MRISGVLLWNSAMLSQDPVTSASLDCDPPFGSETLVLTSSWSRAGKWQKAGTTLQCVNFSFSQGWKSALPIAECPKRTVCCSILISLLDLHARRTTSLMAVISEISKLQPADQT